MASWVRCIEFEDGVDPSFSSQLLVNLDAVRYMVRAVESTHIHFTADDSQHFIAVHETPEQILGVAPK